MFFVRFLGSIWSQRCFDVAVDTIGTADAMGTGGRDKSGPLAVQKISLIFRLLQHILIFRIGRRSFLSLVNTFLHNI
jgi:hypothetical protein